MNEKDLMGMPALGCATKNGHLKTVEALLAGGAEKDAKDNQNGASALITAAFNNRPEIAKILISKGADVNLKNKRGETALFWAKHSGSAEIIQILAAAGAKDWKTNQMFSARCPLNI